MQKTFTNYCALFPSQNKQFRPWEVCSLDDLWSFAASHSRKHFYKSMYLEVIAVLHCNKQDDFIPTYISKACVSSK